MQTFHAEGAPEGPAPRAARRSTGRGAVRGAAAATVAMWGASWLILWVSRDATWYVAPLFAGLAALAVAGPLSRREIGLTWGRGHYAAATLAPLLVVGGVVWLATLTGVARVADTGLGTLGLQVATMAVLTGLGSVVTEDGFFRGALWATLERGGRSTDTILAWTSGAYVVWYLPFLWFEPGLSAGPQAMAVHALNLLLLGLCWGALRLASGSVLVAAWAHGLWNGLAYTLFGFGAARGALGVTDPLRFDPERGWAGVALNAAVFLWLWRRWRRQRETALAEGARVADEADPAV